MANALSPRAIALVALFLATRIFNYLLWFHPDANFVSNDVNYYGYHLHQLLVVGNTSALVEYPLPAVWFMELVYLIGGGWQHWFSWFAAGMFMLDAFAALSLYRRGREHASLFWILFIGACGSIIWFRFDILPAVLVTWACLWQVTRPRLAGGLLAAAAAIKLWPAVLAAPFMTPNPLRSPGRDRLISFLLVGLTLAGASLLIGGWGRNVSPLIWQSDRGLQIESVIATPVMFLRTFTGSPDWPVALSEYQAIEVTGPWVAELLLVSKIATVGMLALTLLLTWRLIRAFSDSKDGQPEAILLVVGSVMLALIISNKVLSPQYVTWLAGPLAVLILYRRSEWLRRPLWILSFGYILVAALTQYTYPWGTYGIMGMPTGDGFETSVLILRNILLIALFGYSTSLAWKTTRSGKLLRRAKPPS